MAKLAAEAGADCVKFQMRKMDELYRKASLEERGNDLGTEYILDLLAKFELTIEQHVEIKNYCEKDYYYAFRKLLHNLFFAYLTEPKLHTICFDRTLRNPFLC